MPKAGNPQPASTAAVSSKEEEVASQSSSTSGSSCTACLRCFRRVIPVGFKEELYQLSCLAGPVFVSQLMIFLIGFVSTVFCGHLGKLELASVALSIAVINVSGISVGTGLASTCDTLISQTYGSGNLKRVGVILQRSILILLLFCFPCWALLINTESLLLAVRQNPEVARMSQLYVKIFMPALPATFMYQLQGRYLQNQGIIWPQVITGAIGNVINALINYIFLYVLDLGVAGSAGANVISQFILMVLLFGYIHWKKLHKDTWAGWTTECLQEWGDFVRLAIPSMFMLCIECWTYEIGGFLAGLISEVELGAQSVFYELAYIIYMVPLGISVAASVRVGNALGAGNTEEAKTTSKVAMMGAGVFAVLLAIIIAPLKDLVGYIFTTEVEIIDLVSKVMVLFAPLHFCDGLVGVSGGIVRGVGRQKFGAICNLVGYYVVGLPVGVSLMFAMHMGIVGLWTGMLLSVAMQAVSFNIFIVKLDWKKVTQEALVRAGVQTLRDGRENEVHVNGIDSADPSPDSKVEEEMAMEDLSPSHTDTEGLGDGRAEGSMSPVGGILSLQQLVLRRGLAVIGGLLILAAGIIVNVTLTEFTWHSNSTVSPDTGSNATQHRF
ncbi:multidrug and toxin extrusion protein 1-like [Acipenser ruthenus]|uniref:multidrug and toxin extrusion protein 1-like n=1 Tax=Acipenser ruthenus TaxID=7906 RepID=UPI0027404094|nr:multidrug and toxin extrusion protein 1-like [Acipenser ruthenus]